MMGAVADLTIRDRMLSTVSACVVGIDLGNGGAVASVTAGGELVAVVRLQCPAS